MKPTQGKAELAIRRLPQGRFLSPWITHHLQQVTEVNLFPLLLKPICSEFSDACTNIRAQKKSI